MLIIPLLAGLAPTLSLFIYGRIIHTNSTHTTKYNTLIHTYIVTMRHRTETV